MSLIGLAGLNFLLYYFAVEPKLLRLGPTDATPALAKVVGVLAFGRLLPYLGTGGG